MWSSTVQSHAFAWLSFALDGCVFVFPWVGLFLIFVPSRFSRHMQPMKTQTTQWSGVNERKTSNVIWQRGMSIPYSMWFIPSSLPISTHLYPWVMLYLLSPKAKAKGSSPGYLFLLFNCYEFNYPIHSVTNVCIWTIVQREKERTKTSYFYLFVPRWRCK